jgi:hypothetical protein
MKKSFYQFLKEFHKEKGKDDILYNGDKYTPHMLYVDLKYALDGEDGVSQDLQEATKFAVERNTLRDYLEYYMGISIDESSSDECLAVFVRMWADYQRCILDR